MKCTIFLDTNVLIYAISKDPAEASKQREASALLERQDLALSVQVLQEFYVQAVRPSRPHALSHQQAVALLEAWSRFTVQDMTMGILNHALEIKHRYRISYWDGAIVAAAASLGCETLASEDLQHGQLFGAVRIDNPFR